MFAAASEIRPGHFNTTRQTARWRFPAVRYLLGVFLLATCGLKLLGLLSYSPPQPGWMGSPRIQMIAIQWEFFLGVWLLSGVRQGAVWLTALGTFLAFAGISGSLVWAGVAKCPCFGSQPVSPWFAFGVDAAALALLGVTPPKTETRDRSWTQWTHRMLPAVWTFLVVGSSLGLAAVGAGWAFGSVQGATVWLRGEPLFLSSDYVDFGSLTPLEIRMLPVAVRNWSDRPVQLLGGTSDCSCATSLDLPLTVPPHGACMVTIRFKAPRSEPGVFTRTVELWTDNERQATLRFRVGCIVK